MLMKISWVCTLTRGLEFVVSCGASERTASIRRCAYILCVQSNQIIIVLCCLAARGNNIKYDMVIIWLGSRAGRGFREDCKGLVFLRVVLEAHVPDPDCIFY